MSFPSVVGARPIVPCHSWKLAESKHLFSAWGNMITKKRCSLKKDTVRRAQCLRSWWLNRDLLGLNERAIPSKVKNNHLETVATEAAKEMASIAEELDDIEGRQILAEIGAEIDDEEEEVEFEGEASDPELEDEEELFGEQEQSNEEVVSGEEYEEVEEEED